MRLQLLAVATACVLLCACGGGGGGAAGSSALPAMGSPARPSNTSTSAPSSATSPSPSAHPSASTPPTNSSGAAPTPTPIATQAPLVGSAPSHIPTWAYDESFAEGASASGALVRQYVTFAQGGYGDDKAQSDCDGSGASACSSVFYFDPNFIYASSGCPSQIASAFMSAASENWYVHETGYSDAAHRVQGSYQQSCNGSTITVPVYLANQSNPNVDAFFASYLQTNANGWDQYFMDDTSASVLTQAYGPGGGFCHGATNNYCTSTNEYPTDASVVAAHALLVSELNHVNGSPMEGHFNGVSFSGSTPTNLNLISATNGRLSGASCENCVVNAGTLESGNYAKVLNAMAAVNATPGGSFIELSTGSSPSGSAAQIEQRLVTTAMAWLGFNGNATIVFPNLEESSSNLAIWPEDSIYPTQPVESMNSGATDIAVSSGVYRREFASCFMNGSSVGPCAALVNSTGSTVTIASTWLKQAYGHMVTLSGGDIESGGSVAVNQASFAVNSSTIPAGGAVLLAR